MNTPKTSGLLASAGVLILRLGAGGAFAFILALNQPGSRSWFFEYQWRIWLLVILSSCVLFVVCGVATQGAAVMATLIWALAAYSELHAGQAWFDLPVRDCEFVFLLGTLVLAGPGKLSIEYWLQVRGSR
jgi:hypothetical protein